MMKIHASQRISATSLGGELRHSAMRYFCTHPPFSVTLFFTLSFFTLGLSLNTTQVEVMKEISSYSSDWSRQVSGSDPCRWVGVKCSENGGSDVVELHLVGYDFSNGILQSMHKFLALQVLDLSNNFLAGEIPQVLTQCTNLISINLTLNRLTGRIPGSIGNLPHLETLSLSSNFLSGSIPFQLSYMKGLEFLDLRDNQLTGSIPSQLFSLSNLKTLDLTSNSLSGGIPQIFSRNLIRLSIGNNRLNGTIPSTVSNAPNLAYLEINNNLLSGPIPEQLANCKELQWLDLGNNELRGPLTYVLPKLLQLHYLKLTNNKFEGTILDELSVSSSLSYIDLSGNLLSGNLPSKIFKLNRLQHLWLQNNRFTGIIPQNIQDAVSLLELRLDRNNLTGTIPPGIDMLQIVHLSYNSLEGVIPNTLSYASTLESVDFSNNMLTGEIPESIASMRHLDVLDLSNNELTGEIPEPLAHVMQLEVLNLSNNKLTGKAPEFLRKMKTLDLSNNKLTYSIPKGKSHSTYLIKISGAIGAVAVFIACCLLWGFLWTRNLHRDGFNQTVRKMLQKVEHPRISYEELLTATDRFNSSNLLAINSFGSVYKGILTDGTRVAVKVLNLMQEESNKIFKAECKVLQKVRHRNLARIITTFSSLKFKALIFEYFSNGSLEKHLYQDTAHACRLGLKEVLNIAIDIAHAVEYLHYDCHVQIVHCDIKPSNVLLDESMTAHLSDFGISRFMGKISVNSVTSTIDLKGSVGYIAPEYGVSGMISSRGDVYSYGILLLEMLTRKRPTDSMFDGDVNLHSWVKRAFPDRAAEVVDKSFIIERADKETVECLISLMRIGLLCSRESAEARPSMRDVSNLLKAIEEDWTTHVSAIDYFQSTL